jgi:NAD+ diphosphatase
VSGGQEALFIFNAPASGDVLLADSGDRRPPPAAALEEFAPYLASRGRVSRAERPCDIWALLGAPAPEGYSFVSRRDVAALCDYAFFNRAGVAYQMMNLTVQNKFCGACGGEMRDHETDRARVCGACGRVVYCSMSPAVIVAVERDGALLMGHGVNFPKGRYSVLAGFVEPGETLEETVAREIYEESRVRVRNVTYFGSQPWPFPNSLMLAFRAEWESGEPTPDGGELSDVRFFEPGELPGLPPEISISRTLIDDWLKRETKDPPMAAG